MKSSPLLDQLLISYSPVFDRGRALCATRLAVFPARPQAAADAADLWRVLAEGVEATPKPAAALPAVWLSVASEALLDGVLQAALDAPLPVLIEVPGFMAQPRQAQLRNLKAAGQALAWGGCPAPDVGAELLACFRCASIAAPEPAWVQAAEGAGQPRLEWVRTGARTSAGISAALLAGARAVAGSTLDDDLVPAGPAGLAPDLRGIVELMQRVEREEPAERMEAVLTADPTLAFRLLRYLNSAAFGLRVEVESFKHGLLMVGHQRLKRWLVLLLASGTQDPEARLLMGLAARRGLILEELARDLGDETLRGEMFICGVFSLLDRMLRQSMPQLMHSVPVPQRVQQSLLERGPYAVHLDLVRALEDGVAEDIRRCAEAALVSRAELNQALLRALSTARELD